MGTVWFDDSDAQAKTTDFLAELGLPMEATSFLDLGCGNGAMLFALREEGWTGPALGVDYSPQSVQLAKQISVAAESEHPVSFMEWDVIAGQYDQLLHGQQERGWDVVLDKGTFDAISLSDDKDAQGRRLCEGYRERVLPLVNDGGVFLLTSCNWTEQELEAWFVKQDAAGEQGRFVIDGRIAYPSFSFGGVKGQTISTLCFKKVAS